MVQTEDLELFDHVKEAHPEWSDAQSWADVSMLREVENAVEKGGMDFNNLTEAFIKAMVRQAHKWIEENLPDILGQVGQFFTHLLEHIGDWVSHGLEWLMDAIGDILTSIDF